MFYRTMILRAVLLVKMRKKVYPLLVRLSVIMNTHRAFSLATFKRKNKQKGAVYTR